MLCQRCSAKVILLVDYDLLAIKIWSLTADKAVLHSISLIIFLNLKLTVKFCLKLNII